MDRILNLMHSLQIYWNISCSRPASSYQCLKDLNRSASSSSSTSCSSSQRWRRLLRRLRADAVVRALRRSTWSCTCDADTMMKMVTRDDPAVVFQYDPVSYAMNFDDNCSWHHHSHRTGIITMIMPISPRLNINMTHDHTPLAS